MKVSKILDKSLAKIARKIIKESKLSRDIKKYISYTFGTQNLTIQFLYNNNRVYLCHLYDSYKNFQYVCWLAAELRGKMVDFASKNALNSLTPVGD